MLPNEQLPAEARKSGTVPTWARHLARRPLHTPCAHHRRNTCAGPHGLHRPATSDVPDPCARCGEARTQPSAPTPHSPAATAGLGPLDRISIDLSFVNLTATQPGRTTTPMSETAPAATSSTTRTRTAVQPSCSSSSAPRRRRTRSRLLPTAALTARTARCQQPPPSSSNKAPELHSEESHAVRQVPVWAPTWRPLTNSPEESSLVKGNCRQL